MIIVVLPFLCAAACIVWAMNDPERRQVAFNFASGFFGVGLSAGAERVGIYEHIRNEFAGKAASESKEFPREQGGAK